MRTGVGYIYIQRYKLSSATFPRAAKSKLLAALSLTICILLFFAFQMVNHPVDAGTLKLWINGSDQELFAYFSYKGQPICPLCNLILADINELKTEHRFAPAFTSRKKDLYEQRKYAHWFC